MEPDASPSVLGALGLNETDRFLWSASATPCSGVTSGVRVNLGELGAERQLAPPLACPSRSLRARFSCSICPCPDMDKPKLPIAGEFREVGEGPSEDLKCPVQVLSLMGRHQAVRSSAPPGGTAGWSATLV